MFVQLILAVILQMPVYHNPVIKQNCPDPTVLDDRARTGYFYAYSTQSGVKGHGRTVNLPFTGPRIW